MVPAEVDDRINHTGTVEQLNIVGISLANTERYGKALISIVDNSDYRHTGATEVESEEVIDYLRTVACVEVVAPLRDNEGGIKASLRSGIVGVGAIAHTFGGGGQYSLVGGHTTSTAPSDAKEELLRVLEDVIDLGEIVGGIG
ncbi:MAG: hypothetical protein JOZ19_16660 [Rubrobacter sp.]|nr:hypothetical protein [Rubrobacter sp.]